MRVVCRASYGSPADNLNPSPGFPICLFPIPGHIIVGRVSCVAPYMVAEDILDPSPVSQESFSHHRTYSRRVCVVPDMVARGQPESIPGFPKIYFFPITGHTKYSHRMGVICHASHGGQRIFSIRPAVSQDAFFPSRGIQSPGGCRVSCLTWSQGDNLNTSSGFPRFFFPIAEQSSGGCRVSRLAWWPGDILDPSPGFS